MLYVPETNFLFVHIPRTGGNAITRTLTRELIKTHDVIAITAGNAKIKRHSTAAQIIGELDLWMNQPQVWFVDRPTPDIIRSDYELFKGIGIKPEYPEGFKEKVKVTRQGSIEFHHYWQGILWDAGVDTITEFFTKGVVPSHLRPIPYHQINELWPTMCIEAGCQHVPELPRWDFELQRKEAGFYPQGVMPR